MRCLLTENGTPSFSPEYVNIEVEKRMKPWAHIDQTDYLDLDLRAHHIFQGVPLHEVWKLDLPGGGDDRKVSDFRTLSLNGKPNWMVKSLFSLRWFLGKVFGWDRASESENDLFRNRLNESDRILSSIETGSKDGPFTVLYVHTDEAASEIKNKTVHAALVWALVPRRDGYRLYWAIYVQPVGRITALYLQLIAPFRHGIVYPSLLGQLHKKWCLTYGGQD